MSALATAIRRTAHQTSMRARLGPDDIARLVAQLLDHARWAEAVEAHLDPADAKIIAAQARGETPQESRS